MEERKASIKKFWYNDNTVGYIVSLPFIIGFLAFTLIPIAVSMYYSVTDYKLGQTPAFIGIQNYLDLLKDERFINSVKVTLIYVVTSVPTKLIFALFVAYLLTQGRRSFPEKVLPTPSWLPWDCKSCPGLAIRSCLWESWS